MNHHAKRLCKDLEALGFRRDYDAEEKTSARRVYVHSNDPDAALKVHDCMSDNTITAALRKANKIADTGWSGPRQPATIRERATVQRRQARTHRERDDRARADRAAAAEREYEDRQAAIRREQALHEIEALMQPGGGR